MVKFECQLFILPDNSGIVPEGLSNIPDMQEITVVSLYLGQILGDFFGGWGMLDGYRLFLVECEGIFLGRPSDLVLTRDTLGKISDLPDFDFLGVTVLASIS